MQILGIGCAKCETLKQNAEQADSGDWGRCRLEKITDIKKITSYGVTTTPALAVDGAGEGCRQRVSPRTSNPS